MRVLMAIILAAAALAACTPESSSNAEVTGAIDNCVRKLYSQYNPKDKKQCVNACISCERGVMTTCSTASTLKGAI